MWSEITCRIWSENAYFEFHATSFMRRRYVRYCTVLTSHKGIRTLLILYLLFSYISSLPLLPYLYFYVNVQYCFCIFMFFVRCRVMIYLYVCPVFFQFFVTYNIAFVFLCFFVRCRVIIHLYVCNAFSLRGVGNITFIREDATL